MHDEMYVAIQEGYNHIVVGGEPYKVGFIHHGRFSLLSRTFTYRRIWVFIYLLIKSFERQI